MLTVDDINKSIGELKNKNLSVKEINDGHHTFEEYIDMRNVYFIALCNAYADISWKSKKHFDEENDPMFNGDFIAGINTVDGPITQHIKMKYWNDLNVIELDRAPKYDGYTNEEIKVRVKSLMKKR